MSIRISRWVAIASACVLSASTTSAFAAVSADEAKQLGTTLTPWGAEIKGNKEGTIPAYTGEAIKIPKEYNPAKPEFRPDPFADDKPLFSITAQNYMQYADKLSEGQKELFKKQPAFQMDIYPSRRTARYPQYVVNNTLKNATSCKLEPNGGLSGCYGGFAFPIPKNGAEVIWNKHTQYKQHAWATRLGTYVIPPNRETIVQGLNVADFVSELYNPLRTAPVSGNTQYAAVRIDTVAPARRNGEKLLFVSTVDQVNRGYQYIPGQRRVKLAPDLAYDTPNPQSGGVYTMDESGLFWGQLDRYDFKLEGKKENFILYNDYKAADPRQCPMSKLLVSGFPNRDCLRWELHRVWVVTATLKPGFRHIYPKRTFYFDEDIPAAGTAENYDSAGHVYRVVNVLPAPYYEGPGISADNFFVNDLMTGMYCMASPSDQGTWHAVPKKPDSYYTPEALAAEGIR